MGFVRAGDASDMTWYYAMGDEPRGPVDQTEFERLVQQGVIAGDTLVWREGMADWRPRSEVADSPAAPPSRPAPATSAAAVDSGAIVCSECGRGFGPDQVIRLGSGSVCAECKPVALQKIREGVVDNQSEQIRRDHLSHESSIQSVGFLCFLGAVACLLAGTALSASSRPWPGVFLLLLGGVYAWTGFGLRRLERWSRVAAGVFSGLALLNFPIGTLLGVYILYLLFSTKGAMVFSDQYKQVIKDTPHLRYRTPIVGWILLAVLVLLLAGLTVGLLLAS